MATNTEVKIMVVDDDIRWAQGLEENYREAHIDFRPPIWLQRSYETALERVQPDLVLWDCTASDEAIIKLVQDVHHHHPMLPMVLLVDFQESEFVQYFAEITAIDLLRSPTDIKEVIYRVRRLIRSVENAGGIRNAQTRSWEQANVSTNEESVVQTLGNPFSHLALDLYNSESGRLDARKVGALFGIKLVDLARLLKQKLPTLSKTPDAPSIQAGLALFQRVGLALAHLVGSPEGIRIWMNAPNPQLEGKTPLSLVLSGHGEVVAEMLEDMLVGQPA